MKYYFLSSSHLEDRIWFRDDEDFKSGMNFVPIAALRCHVFVIAFVLMSNHVHFVLMGDEHQMKEFYSMFKLLYSKYMRRKYGTSRFLRENALDCREISSLREGLECVIAYVLMNPVVANICLAAEGYPWGSGCCYFSSRRTSGRKVSELSVRERSRVLHSILPAGEDCILGEDGYILPESYVCWSKVEALYRTPNRMSFFLRNSSKARRILEERKAMLPSFKDQSLVLFAKDICLSLFRKSEIIELEEAELQRLVYELSRRSSSDVGQLARVLGLRPRDVSAMLSKE